MPWTPSSTAAVPCARPSRSAGSLLRRIGSDRSGRFPPTPSPGARDKSAAVILLHGDEDEHKPLPPRPLRQTAPVDRAPTSSVDPASVDERQGPAAPCPAAWATASPAGLGHG